ncbi:hypothetical protein [Bernardetia sp.]|uniref:hypothetical protein n=1 Tax=Bernardetia sp. TaxID=1937974 RepID=UPI0025B8AC3D|nr:hypothetical protein [Bernardetia sp.]
MAETNLGQVGAIWLNDAEPPHKNMLWLKTINQLTNEKEGLIWNGIEWINIQGQSFYWKSEFDVNTDYTKNDVVRFSDQLYIKLNNTTSSGDTPDVSADFELFLPSLTPSGEEGSVQLKDANGRFFGSDLLSFIAGVFSVYGSFFLKSNASSTGNALEVKNSSNTTLARITNDGYILGGTTVARVGFNASNYTLYQAGSVAVFVNGVVRMNVLHDSVTLSVPLLVSEIRNVTSITSGANMLFRSSQGGANSKGFDMGYYAGKGGTDSFKSGVIKLGYTQRNNVDVDVLTIQELNPNSTDGKARVIWNIKEIYADDTEAVNAGAPVNTVYSTPTGELRRVV